MAYNEDQRKKSANQHIFFPGPMGLTLELALAIGVLFTLNLNNIGNKWLSDAQTGTNPVEFILQIVSDFYTSISHQPVVEQVSIFTLWALVGMLSYILIFRILQITLSVGLSVGEGVRAVRIYHRRGLFKWLASLNDFFVKSCVIGASILFFFFGTALCFGVANESLTRAVSYGSQEVSLLIFSSILWAYLGVRIIMSGLYLAVPAFRRFYGA